MSRRGDCIRKRIDGRWEGRYQKCRDKNGKIKYGSVYGKSYGEVKEKLNQYALHNCCQVSKNDKVFFSDVLRIWSENNKIHQKNSTMLRYQNLIDTHIVPGLGFYDVKDITSTVVNTFLSQKIISGRIDGKGGLSNAYVKSMMIIIKSALKYASDEEMCPPLKTPIFKPLEEKKDLRVLSKREQKILEDFLLDDINETKIGILLSLHAGLRIGEVCALSWNDIDLNNKIIHIRHTVTRIKDQNGEKKTTLILDSPKTKTSKRDIPISTFLFEILWHEKARAKSDFVISQKKDFVSPRTYEYRYHRLLKNCCISSVNYHALRHTFATRCVELGVDIKSLCEILGHSNVSITLNTYVHSSMEFKRDQLERLSVVSI